MPVLPPDLAHVESLVSLQSFAQLGASAVVPDPAHSGITLLSRNFLHVSAFLPLCRMLRASFTITLLNAVHVRIPVLLQVSSRPAPPPAASNHTCLSTVASFHASAQADVTPAIASATRSGILLAVPDSFRIGSTTALQAYPHTGLSLPVPSISHLDLAAIILDFLLSGVLPVLQNMACSESLLSACDSAHLKVTLATRSPSQTGPLQSVPNCTHIDLSLIPQVLIYPVVFLMMLNIAHTRNLTSTRVLAHLGLVSSVSSLS